MEAIMSIKGGWEGRYYEDFEVGDLYRHPLGRTISETDNTWFTLLTMNPNQLHFNREYGARTEFGQCLVDSTLTLAIVTGLSVNDLSQNAVANLGWDEVRLHHPVFAGDTLYAESQVISKRESDSRPYAGIIEVKTRGINQNGKVLLTFRRSIMVYKRDYAPQKGIFPSVAEDE
jgi:itaconyl-CoA hydratase